MATGAPPTTPFAHYGRAGEAVSLGLVNMLLNLATLFVWRFWGKTRIRRFLWSHTTIWGDPLEYTGRGGELFVGFLVVLVLVFLPLSAGYGLAAVLNEQGNPLGAALVSALYLVVMFLVGAGLWRARRYQLSRTRWRGIRAGQGGSAWKYGLTWLGVAVLAGLTAGWSIPWSDMLLARTRLAHTTFGTQEFTCSATAGPLYRQFAVFWFGCALLFAAVIGIAAVLGVAAGTVGGESAQEIASFAIGALVLALPLLSLPWAWYRAAFYRRLAEGTAFGQVRFVFAPGAWALVRVGLGNLILTAATLGIGRPWAASRIFRFVCTHVRVIGEPDFAAIRQSVETAPRTGEGLAAVFDGAGDF